MKKKTTYVAGALAALLLAAGSAFAQAKTEVLWLGHSAFRITTPGGKAIMIDPWLLGNPKTPAAWKNLDAVGKLDLILVTHGHADHIADAPALATKNNVPVSLPGGLGTSLTGLGVLPPALVQRFHKGGTITPFGPQGVKVTMVRAEHSSEYLIKNATTGREDPHPGGEPVGYVIELENGFRIYHMGDTDVFGDLKLIGERLKPDLVLVPIGGLFTMGPKDAAFALREYLKPKYAIPMHFGTSAAIKGTPQELIEALGNSPIKVLTPNPGDKIDF